MNPTLTLSTRFGFKPGPGGSHQARSMMLSELATLFESVPEQGALEDYRTAVIDENSLSKKTQNNRNISFRHLRNLYSLDPDVALFRVLRRLWDLEPQARPLLAFQCAYAHDPLLRASATVILSKHAGEPATREEIEGFLKKQFEDKLRRTSIRSFAQNLNGSWTQAGFLKGKVNKIRVHPWAGVGNTAFALFTAFLAGYRGEALLRNEWTALLDIAGEEILSLAEAASQRGLMRLLRIGSVMEFRFSGYLTEEEEMLIHGQD